MGKEALSIDNDYFSTNYSDFRALKESANKILCATKSEFETMRKEKWFTRLFDMVTFSKKTDIRLGNQIGSLAQAQEILLEILLRLSQNDRRISEVLSNSQFQIKKLAEQDIQLAKRLIQVENVAIFGILSPRLSITDFSEHEKKILAATITHIATMYKNPNPHQKNYANALLKVIDEELVLIADLHKALDSITNTVAKKAIFQCALEIIFLNSCNFDDQEMLDLIVELFDYGKKALNETIKIIQEEYRVRGEQRIAEKYGTATEMMEDEFFVDFDIDLNHEFSTPQDRESVVIDQILDIPSGNVRTYQNKNISIKSYITCSGSLVFKNCTVYGEGNSAQILLREGAELEFIQCELSEMINNNTDNFFIKTEGPAKININNSHFDGCQNWLNLASSTDLIIEKSKFINPMPNLIVGSNFTEISGRLNSCIIELINLDKYSKFETCDRDERIKGSVFDFCTHPENPFTVLDVHVENVSSIIKNPSIFDIDGSIYSNCTFINITDCVHSPQSVVKSLFVNSKFCIFASFNEAIISDVIFSKCSEMLISFSITNLRSKISGCQFFECTGSSPIISSGKSLQIEFCQFCGINVNNQKNERGVINIKCWKDGDSSSILRCEFKNVYNNSDSIIFPKIFENPKSNHVEVDQCSFENCGSINDKLIKTEASYFGLFDKIKTVNDLVRVSNCSGLDVITKSYVPASTYKLRLESRSGEKIGSNIKSLL